LHSSDYGLIWKFLTLKRCFAQKRPSS
jgi:hypothetical protein